MKVTFTFMNLSDLRPGVVVDYKRDDGRIGRGTILDRRGGLYVQDEESGEPQRVTAYDIRGILKKAA